MILPEAYHNMSASGEEGQSCRLGKGPFGVFSGVTLVMDYCAHPHRDVRNLVGGCTVVLTTTKPGSDTDEQLHYLTR